MKKIFLGVCILFVKIIWGQPDKVVSVSLNDAIQRAISNRYDLKIQKLNTQISENETDKVKTRSMPQITSDLDLRYNSQLQTNILPGNFLGPPNAPNKEVQFGTKYNTLWGFNLTQTLFNPTNLSDRKIASIQSEYQRLNEKLTETAVKQEVTEAYFSALLWKEKTRLSAENVNLAAEIYQLTQDQLNQAQATTYDVQRNKINLENARAQDEQNKRSFELSCKDLLYKISDDSLKNITLSDRIDDLLIPYSANTGNKDEIKRTELIQEKIQFDIYQLNIRKQKLSYLPSLSFYANYSLQFLNNDFTPFTSANWYPFNYLGFKASFPIFDGGLKSKTKKEFELRSEASTLNQNKLRRDFEQEVQSAKTALDNALTDLNYQKKNLELIGELYKLDTDRFKSGILKQNDLHSTLYTLQQTQTNYLTSVYTYLVAVVRYKKALGIL